MKTKWNFILALVILSGSTIIAQTTDTENMANTEKIMPDMNQEVSNDADAGFNFIDFYEIEEEKGKMAKTLGESLFRVEPSASSSIYDFTIPQGTIITAYKYYPKEAVWAVKYKGEWGFVPATMVMPIKQQTMASKYTPYDQAPKIISRIKFQYPTIAQKSGIEGRVLLKVLVGKTGSVKEVEVINGIPELDDAAVKAVKNVKFKPGKYKGKPVDVWVRIPIDFRIN
jgi:TonB family protein